MPYKRLGTPRKNGPAKRGMGQAAWKRYNRAINKMDTTDKTNKRDINDITTWLKVAEIRATETKHPSSLKAVDGIKENLLKANALYVKIKEENSKRNKTKPAAPNMEVDDDGLAEQICQIIGKLKDGEVVEGYTILSTDRAYTNQTVEALQDLPDGETLCKYKG